MSKRKRSWEVTSLANHEQPGAGALAAYGGDHFTRPSVVHARTQSSGVLSEAADNGIVPIEAASIDQRLHAVPVNGPRAETSSKPRGSGVAIVASEALPGLTRKITACAACRKQKVGPAFSPFDVHSCSTQSIR